MDQVVHRLTDRDRARLRELITEYSGLSEAAVADGALEQAVAQRLVENRLDSLADYWALLQMRPGEKSPGLQDPSSMPCSGIQSHFL